MSRAVWGICGAGGISNDFSLALANNGSTIGAVAASDADKAKKFAADFGAPRSYGSYAALAEDTAVTIVYVGTVHTKHLEHTLLFLKAGKHVLVEKPMALNEAQVQQMVDAARENNVFLMEAFWTRCFPVVRRAQEVLESGVLGKPLHVVSDFGFKAPDDPSHRLWSKELAGGGLLDIGCYVLQWATLALGRDVVPEFRALAELSATGVDKRAALALKFPEGGTATLSYHFDCAFVDRTTIKCENGVITIDEPSHCPTRIRIATSGADDDRAMCAEEFEVALPVQTMNCGGRKVNYGSSEGLIYEAQEVERCLAEGLLESPTFTLTESLLLVKLTDAIRKDIGVVYAADTP